jgi:hypothetical protein
MNRTIPVMIAGILLLSASHGEARPRTAAEALAVQQDGSYTFTRVRDGRVMTHQITPQGYDRLSAKLPVRMERRTAQFQERTAQAQADGRRICAGGTGAPNSATVDQADANNLARVAQLGSGNSAGVDQSGGANQTYLMQFGNNRQAQTAQSGDHNIIYAEQRCR